MSEEERPNQSRRYCTNCGAEVRAGTTFCVSCGASLVADQMGSGHVNSGAGSPGPTSSFADSLLGSLRGLNVQERLSGARRWLSGYRPNLGAGSARGVVAGVMRWFGGLHPVIKMLLAGAVLLVVAVLLSPLMRVVAIIAFLASVALLIWHGTRRRFAPRWAAAAVSSLVLVFVFGGISGAVYGPDETASGSGPADPEPTPMTDSGASPSPSSSPGPSASPDPSASPSAGSLEPGDEITITVQPWGSFENINYDGREVLGAVFEYEGQRVMVLADPMSSAGNQLFSMSVDIDLGSDVPPVTVHGEYQGAMSLEDGRSYEAILADSIEYE